MKTYKLTGKALLVVFFACALAYGCNEQKPSDPSEGKENIQNDQGENYGAKGDDRPEPSQPGASTTSNHNTSGTDTTQNKQ
jgi:hypothetical protein